MQTVLVKRFTFRIQLKVCEREEPWLDWTVHTNVKTNSKLQRREFSEENGRGHFSKPVLTSNDSQL